MFRTSRLRNLPVLWNALMSAIVFLPVLLVVTQIEALFWGSRLEGGIIYHLGSGLYLYMSYLLLVVGGSVVHSLALILVPPAWSRDKQRLAVVLLSPLLPATILLIARLAGGWTFLPYAWVAMTVATVTYGLCAKVGPREMRPDSNLFEST